MIQLYEGGAYLVHGSELVPEREAARVEQLTGKAPDKEEARKGTIAYSILQAHNTSGSMNHLKIKFDAMASHDITFVGIIQTAKASGMETFPLPYVLTNCTIRCAPSAARSTKTTTYSDCRQLRNTAASLYRLTSPSSTSTCGKRWPAAAR